MKFTNKSCRRLAISPRRHVAKPGEAYSLYTGCEKSIGPPCHTKFDLFSIVLGKSDETMPYRLDLGNSFGVVYIAVTYLVQELC